ncbi:MAG TPA: hypothetical protein VMW24_22920 [Sedimentisphaerales bacterium]|nr:hypothetical protein [Sedimentisphaerales bacterium]
MPTARSVKMDSARALIAADPTGMLLRFIPKKAIARIYADLDYAFRERIYTPLITVCMMILQALDDDASLRKAVD